MPCEIDRCEVCAGAGRISFDGFGAMGTHPQPVPLVNCDRCHSTGYLDPIASLLRAIDRGQTLAWCMAHASDGDDPLPALWTASNAAREKTRLMELVRPGRASVLLGQRRKPGIGAAGASPTLAEVLQAVKTVKARGV